MTAIEFHVGLIYTTVVDITATEHTSGLSEEDVGCGLRVILKFLDIAFVEVFGIGIIGTFGIIIVTHITIVQSQVGCAEDSTTLATTVGITLDSGYAVGEGSARHVANDYVGLAWNVTYGRSTDIAGMMTNMT